VVVTFLHKDSLSRKYTDTVVVTFLHKDSLSRKYADTVWLTDELPCTIFNEMEHQIYHSCRVTSLDQAWQHGKIIGEKIVIRKQFSGK
jgi:hypothetical protein